MNTELQTILGYMERERGIDREVLIEAVEFALQSAARKSMGDAEGVRVEIDRETCDMTTYATLEVVDKIRPADDEIAVEEARKVQPGIEVGATLETKVTPRNFGRIAAQTAKQAILQRIRQAEREIVFDEYKDRVGDIVSGSVRQFNRSDIIVDLGRAEAIMPSRERVPTEEYQVGDRVRAFITSVESNPSGPSVILSRGHPNFVRCLFELEVAEITEGVVEIKGIAREPGYRTKIAVLSHDDKVDPVGACVGMRGIRVKNIVRELSGEKIDIVRWSDDLRTYVANALSPAKLSKIYADEADPGLVHVIVDTDQLSLAIGKRGQNVRLTAKLIGVKVDIQKDESGLTFDEKVARAVETLAAVDGISREQAEALVQSGFLTLEGVLAAEKVDLTEGAGLSEEDADAVLAAAAAETETEDG